MLSLISIGFVAACVIYVYVHSGDFYFILTVSRPELVVATLLILSSFMATCYQLDLFLKRFNLRLGKLELIAITHAMMLGNLVIPMRGGSGGLAIYLKKVHKLDFTAFALIYGGTALLVALINSAFALIALKSLWIYSSYFQSILFAFALGLFVTCLYVTVWPPSIQLEAGSFLCKVVELINSWRAIALDKRLVVTLTASITLMSLSLIGSLFFIYSAIGHPLTFEATVVTSSVGAIVSLLPLTPGSIGIFDVAIIEIQRIFGLTTAQSIAAAMIFRTMTFLLAFVIGAPSFMYMYVRSSKPYQS